MWSAIAYFQQSAGFERPVKSAALKALHLKATKLAALGANKPRDIIPLECVRRFCGMKESETPRGIAAAALVTTGIRALLRCSELQRLKVEHITERDGMLLIDESQATGSRNLPRPVKNWQLDVPSALDEETFGTERRADGAKGGDYVFPAARGGKASPAVISSLLDMVVRGAPECRDLNAINAFSRYKCIRIDFVLYFDPFVENFRGGVFNVGRLFSNRDSDYGGLEVGCVFAISQNVGPRCKTGVNGKKFKKKKRNKKKSSTLTLIYLNKLSLLPTSRPLSKLPFCFLKNVFLRSTKQNSFSPSN